MKYILVVGDGMADEPIAGLGNRTPLEAAITENMDLLARDGLVGMVKTVPDGFKPGSDVANLNLLGYDPCLYYPGGRGPIEAASIGVELDATDCAFRCNLVIIQDDRMEDFTSGYIDTEDAVGLIAILNTELSNFNIHFYPGLFYRHLCVIKGKFENLKCTAPHDITGKIIQDYLPVGTGEALVNKLMNRSKEILLKSKVNARRISQGKKPVTQIWLWGHGYRVEIPAIYEKYGVRGAVISAVDLIKGIGRLAGLEVVNVKGATGWIDTNYEGKADAALKCLQEKDFVFVHIVSTDETSHTGDVSLKIKAIEDLDKRFLGRLLNNIDANFRILVMPDHPTPVRIKTHTSDPVPFLLYGKDVQADKAKRYSEAEAEKSGLFIREGHELLNLLIKGAIKNY
ncbi:MAG: cofactor-independent phosphoglycerate mutase [Candidatus Latescibacteria bacterium]|nr:cofactor-independent phosphoglycerate mutase [Candidatus Latescibacterota bacterium]